MEAVPVKFVPRGFGETYRRDWWWIEPMLVFTVFTSFIIYATWAAFQNANYTHGPYLSPFYSPEIWGDSPHAWFGPKPAGWPAWLPFSPALIILPVPALFRFTCYYYRGAYYKAFWADPVSCAVSEPRHVYRGEHSFPLILQNAHRYFFYIALVFLLFLAHDVWKAMWFADPVTGRELGIVKFNHSHSRAAAFSADSQSLLAVFSCQAQNSFTSLATLCPQVSLFEREIAEQCGLRPDGHPWLKPVRFPQGGVGLCDFYRVEGEQVHEVAHRYLDPARATLVIAGPYDGD